MSVVKTLRMVFKTVKGKKITCTLADPKADITRAQIEPSLNSMITNQVIMKDEDAAVKIDSLHLKTVEDIEL